MSSAWPKVRLDECADIVAGATPSTSIESYWGGDVCWATPKDLSDLDGSYISDTPRKLTQAGLQNCAATILPAGSVLFSSRAPIGHVAVNTVPMATNQGFKSFVPKPERTDAKFLYWWLRTNRAFLESLGNGATFKEVSKTIVSRIEISLPPLAEQRRIAEVLDRAEALRAKRRAALAQLDTLTQSLFLDLFGDPRKQGSTGKTPTKPQPLGELTRIRTGKLDANAADEEGAHPFFTCAVEPLRINTPAFDCKAVLVAGNGDLNVKYFEGKFNAYQRTYVIESLDESVLVPKFLYAFLDLYVSELRKQAIGGVIKYIKLPYLTDAVVQLPSEEWQREFARRVTAVEKLKAAQRASLAELDALFATLQHRAFRGEL